MSTPVPVTSDSLPNHLASPLVRANVARINATSRAYSCMLDLAELGLDIIRVQVDEDGPTLFIKPPQDPARVFGQVLFEEAGCFRPNTRIYASEYRTCLICWEGK